jgi:hypothetical protein
MKMMMSNYVTTKKEMRMAALHSSTVFWQVVGESCVRMQNCVGIIWFGHKM